MAEASTGFPSILSRQLPVASKFSKAIPQGSIFAWQESKPVVSMVLHSLFEGHLQDFRIAQIDLGTAAGVAVADR